MEEKTSLVSFLFIFLTSCSSVINGTGSTDIISIQSNSSCVVNSSQLCILEEREAGNDLTCYTCDPRTSNISNIADNNNNTVWSSRTINELPNGVAEIYIKFNKLYSIESVSVSFVTPQPLNWSIDYYNTSTVVKPVLLVVNNTSLNCLPDYPVCITRNTTSKKLHVRQLLIDTGSDINEFNAKGIKLSFITAAPPVVNDSELFYSVSEVTIEGSCADDDCEMCGRCVSDHVEILTNLSVSIQRVRIPPYTILIITNETDLERINNLIMEKQADALEGQFYLIAAERDYGISSEYPPGVTVPTHIVTYDNLYSTTILYDLSLIDQLLVNSSQFDYLNETVRIVTMKGEEVTHLLNNIKDPLAVINETRVLLSDLVNQLILLTDHRDSILAFQKDADSSLSIILSRVYTDTESDVNHLINTTLIYYDSLNQHNTDSLLHSEQSRNASNAVNEYKRLLPQVINIINIVMSNISEAMDNVDKTDEILENIKILLQFHSSLLVHVTDNINIFRSVDNETETVLATARDTANSVDSSLTVLQLLTDSYNNTLEQYWTNLSPYLPPLYPGNCSVVDYQYCTAGERHYLSLADNVTLIQVSSADTLTHARRFLTNLSNVSDAGFDYINITAKSGIELSQAVLESLRDVDLVSLESATNALRSDIVGINSETLMLIPDTEKLRNDSLEQYDRSIELRDQYESLFADFNALRSEVNNFESPTNFTLESSVIKEDADQLISDLDVINISVNSDRVKVISLNEEVDNISNIINKTNDDIEFTLSEVSVLRGVFNTTGYVIQETRSNLRSIMEENNDILSEIDQLLDNIADTHDLVKKINSPANLQLSGSTSPYLSLQPPPGLTNTSQELLFQSFDMYLFPAASYSPPSLLFYAGPIAMNTAGPNASSILTDDYIALTSESSQSLLLQWRMNGVTGSVSRAGVISGHTEIYFISVGSMFELQLIEPNQRSASQSLSLINGSLSLSVSDRTVFLVGGQPDSSLLAISGVYSSYFGLVHLILFNGNLWSLWDYRSRSDTVFAGGFKRDSDGALDNVWIPSKQPAARTNVLSFNGKGSYLKPVRFYHSGTFGSSGTLTFTLFIKSVEGLVAYLTDPVSNVTLQLALTDGNVVMIVSGPTFKTLNLTTPIGETDFTGRSYSFQFSGNNIRYVVSGRPSLFPSRDNFAFFTDLTRIEAWFGGVAPPISSMLDFVTSSSYRGCLDVDLQLVFGGTRIDILNENFIQNYLSSSIQRGVSGTCLSTETGHQVSYNGSGYLSYSSYRFVPKVNNPNQQISLNDKVVFSFSFYPVSDNRVLLYTTSEGGSILVGIRESSIAIELGRSGSATSLSGNIRIKEWNNIILEISSSNFKLYIDGLLKGMMAIPNGFSFNINTNTLHIGGSPATNDANYTGCIKDLSYNFQLFQLMSPALAEYIVPVGVSFDNCQFINERTDPLVDPFAAAPQVRSCFVTKPVELSETVGGFHVYSSLHSYNALPLRESSWSLSFFLRRLSGDGHVITVSSVSGVSISIMLESGGIINLRLRGENNVTRSLATNTPLPINTWSNISLIAGIINEEIIIELIINDNVIGSVKTSYKAGVKFEPLLPHVIGRKENVLGFAGCLKDLKLNDNSTSFDKEELSSCITCYSQFLDGWGFSGLSYIKKRLATGVGVMGRVDYSMKFRPSRDHGLLLLIINTTSTQPLLGIGLYEGEVRVSNFSVSGAYITQSQQSLCRVGEDPVFNSLNVSISYSNDEGVLIYSISFNDTVMTVTSSSVVNTINDDIDLYIGGIPTTGLFSNEVDYFSFLIRGTTGLPPRFIGCLQQVILTSSSEGNQLANISQADEANEVLVGLCPSP